MTVSSTAARPPALMRVFEKDLEPDVIAAHPYTGIPGHNYTGEDPQKLLVGCTFVFGRACVTLCVTLPLLPHVALPPAAALAGSSLLCFLLLGGDVLRLTRYQIY